MAKPKPKPKAKAKSTVKAKPKMKPQAKPKAKAKAKAKAKPKSKPKSKAKIEEPAMPAPLRNKFWTMRSSHGRKPKFTSSVKLMAACEEYFEWVQANPLTEYKQYHHQGQLTNGLIPKMRAMTVKGLCIFLDIAENTWLNYSNPEKANKDFLRVTTRVREIIDTQKFEGAAADLLNPNIIARDLGLKDSRELSGPDDGPIEIDYAESARARLRGKLIPEAGSE